MSTLPPLLLWLLATLPPLAGLWLLWRLLLRSERCLRYNRALLLLAPLLAGALPLLPMPALPTWLPEVDGAAFTAPAVLLPTMAVSEATGPAEAAWQSLVLPLYVLGVALGLGWLGWQLGQLWWVTRRLPREVRPGYQLVCTNGQLPTSSFGSIVFWDETTTLTPAEAHAVLAHEQAHVRQGHTLDRLWSELWRIALWPNPFAHLLLPALRLTHELLADEAAAEAGAAAAYPVMLAQLAVRRLAGPGYFALLQPFTFSFILTRIAMLQKSTPVRRWKQWLALPVLGGLFVVACRTTDVRPASAPSASALPPPVSVTYRNADKDGRRLAYKKLLQLDSLQTKGKPPVDAIQTFVNAPMGTTGFTTLSIYYKYKNAGNTTSVPAGPKVYTYVEQMPHLPGSTKMQAVAEAIQANLAYPTSPDGKQLPEARSFVSFTVKPDGTVGDINVVKSAGAAAYDMAIIDAIHKLPRFEPGRQDGQAVAVSFTVPVTFKPQP